MNLSGSKKQELSSSTSVVRGIGPDSMIALKKPTIELDVNQDAANQTVVSDIVSTRH